MPRVKRGTTTHRRHAALLERTTGFRNGRRTQVKRATEALLHADQYAYRDRRNRKRDLRRGWIVRINAAARANGLSYSAFMAQLKTADSTLNRKVLAELALQPTVFTELTKQIAAK